MPRYLTTIILCIISLYSIGQISDSSSEKLQKQAETLFEQNELQPEIDYSESLNNIEQFIEKPININDADSNKLAELKILDDIQIHNLLSYRKRYGQIISKWELDNINGFDEQTIEKFLPLIVIKPVTPENKLRPKDLLSYSSNSIIFRVRRKLEVPDGYLNQNDSLTKINKKYLGSPERAYFRYKYEVNKHISAGLTADKDAGEQFLKETQKKGFDFYSAHLFIRNIGIIKSIAIGDYSANFGQGLTFQSGLAPMFSSDPLQIRRFPTNIKPYTSSNELGFLRGIATTISFYKFDITTFLSKKSIDASISNADTNNDIFFINSIRETGYHNTTSTINSKNSAIESIIGGHINYNASKFRLGATSFYRKNDLAIASSNTRPYNIFNDQNKFNKAIGVDFSYCLSPFSFFGEASAMSKDAYAAIIGVNSRPSSFISYSIIARNYSNQYINPYNKAYSATQGGEKGIYIGISWLPLAKWSIQSHLDNYQSLWMTSYSNAPIYGQDFALRVQHSFSRNLVLIGQWKQGNSRKNILSKESRIAYPEQIQKNAFHFQLNNELSSLISLKSRVEFIEISNKNKGYAISQDIKYKLLKLPIQFNLSYTIFDSKNFDTRIYLYENDVLYSYSSSMLYGNGNRFYILAQYSPTKKVKTWIKYSITRYTDRTFISSGLDKINGNTVSELCFQIMVKF